MTVLLQLWDAVVVSAAVIVLAVTAIGMMVVGLVELSRALKRIALALGCTALLQMMPPVIVGIWRTLSPWQHLGLLILLAAFATIISNRALKKTNPHEPRH